MKPFGIITLSNLSGGLVMTEREEWPFVGPLTRGQAMTWHGQPIQEELKSFVPEQCKDCWWHLENRVVYRLTTQVVMGEIATIDAAKKVVDYTRDCAGSRPDETMSDSPVICPKQQDEKRRDGTVCW